MVKLNTDACLLGNPVELRKKVETMLVPFSMIVWFFFFHNDHVGESNIRLIAGLEESFEGS